MDVVVLQGETVRLPVDSTAAKIALHKPARDCLDLFWLLRVAAPFTNRRQKPKPWKTPYHKHLAGPRETSGCQCRWPGQRRAQRLRGYPRRHLRAAQSPTVLSMGARVRAPPCRLLQTLAAASSRALTFNPARAQPPHPRRTRAAWFAVGC